MSIVFLDESGHMLQPVCRRTWAPRGQTPIHYSWDRRDRLSTLAAITRSPVRVHLQIVFRIHRHNIRSPDVVEGVTLIYRHVRRKLIVVLDRYSVHRKAIRELQEAHPDWLIVEWLPAYAPDLNPTEQVWNHSKYCDLANFIPEDIDHLYEELTQSITNQQDDQGLLRSFFKTAGLKP